MRVALIGCGRIGKRHADILIGMSSLAAICDIDTGAMRLTDTRGYRVPQYEDYHEMMGKVRPDVVVVATPSGMHAEHVLDLRQYDTTVVVEKPLCLRREDIDAILTAYRDGPSIYVVLQNRLNLPVSVLRRHAHRLGKLILLTARVRWHRDSDYFEDWHGDFDMAGGVLLNQAIHHLDLLTWFGGPVESVIALKEYALTDEVDDVFIGVTRFENGALGVIEATTAAHANLEGSLSVLGENGTVEIGGFAVNKMMRFEFNESRDTDNMMLKAATNPPDVYGFGHIEFWSLMKSKFEGKSIEPGLLVTPQEAATSLKVALAMYEAAETGKRVYL